MNTSYILSIYNTDDQEVNILSAILLISPDSDPIFIIKNIVRDNYKGTLTETGILEETENVLDEELDLYYMDPATGHSVKIYLDQE